MIDSIVPAGDMEQFLLEGTWRIPPKDRATWDLFQMAVAGLVTNHFQVLGWSSKSWLVNLPPPNLPPRRNKGLYKALLRETNG